MYDLLGVFVHRLHITFLPNQHCYLCGNRYLYPSTTMEVMADNVLSESEKQFIRSNATMIRQFASGQFGGGIPMEIRQQLESITNKLGRRYMISWTCSPCLKKIGLQLEPYTWQ